MSKPMPLWAIRSAVRAIYESNAVSRREANALTWTLHLETVIRAGSMSGRTLRRETLRRLVARGLMAEAMGVVVDGDGFHVEPERERVVYTLTDRGRELAQKIKAEEDALMRRQFTATETPTP